MAPQLQNFSYNIKKRYSQSIIINLLKKAKIITNLFGFAP